MLLLVVLGIAMVGVIAVMAVVLGWGVGDELDE